jgi:ech hydrogenase subunit D
VSEEQKVREIAVASLLEAVQEMHSGGWRLVHVCCTRLAAGHEVSYCFDRDHHFESLRVGLPLDGAALPSISSFYWSAFLYENEIHDLFGVAVRGMAVDFHGSFYRTRVPIPYANKDPYHAG